MASNGAKPFKSYDEYMGNVFDCVNRCLYQYLEGMKGVYANGQGGYKNVLYPDLEVASDSTKEQMQKFSWVLTQAADDDKSDDGGSDGSGSGDSGADQEAGDDFGDLFGSLGGDDDGGEDDFAGLFGSLGEEGGSADEEMDELPLSVTYEPGLALRGGKDGLDFYGKLCQIGKDNLITGGALAVEHGYLQQEAVIDIFMQNGYKDVTGLKDYGGNPRVVIGIWRGDNA